MEFPSVNPLVIKNIITDTSVPSVDPSIIIFFLLPTDLPTEKKLPIKDSLTEYFRR